MEGNVGTLSALLEQNVGDVDMLNWTYSEKAQATPLIAAAAAGHASCIRILLSQPAIDVNRATTNGDTALILSSIQGHRDCVSLLLAIPGINVNHQNKFGNTALVTAAAQGHVECTRMLLKMPGIDLSLVTKKGQDALHLAKNEEVRIMLTTHLRQAAHAKAAISAGPRVWAAAKRGDATLLKTMVSEWKNNASVLCWADPDKNNYTPLIAACYKGNTACAKILLTQSCVDANQVDRSGQTALILSSFYGHAECTKLLLSAKGIKANHASTSGLTALMVSAQKGHVECVRLLLNVNGIDAKHAAHNSKTALDMAASEEIKAMLKAHLSSEEGAGVDID